MRQLRPVLGSHWRSQSKWITISEAVGMGLWRVNAPGTAVDFVNKLPRVDKAKPVNMTTIERFPEPGIRVLFPCVFENILVIVERVDHLQEEVINGELFDVFVLAGISSHIQGSLGKGACT